MTGKIDPNTPFSATDFRSVSPRFTEEARAANMAMVELVKRMAGEKRATPAQIALAWLLARRPWIVPIPGTRKLSRLEENIGAASVELDEKDLREMEEAASKITVQGARPPEEVLRLTHGWLRRRSAPEGLMGAPLVLCATALASGVAMNKAQHLRTDDRLENLMEHPAFAGFAPLLLPWDDRPYDPAMPLKNIGSLLPYHSNVDAAVVVSSLNRMIDDASAGRTVFYEIYADDRKQNTGLFFFRGKPGAPFALIAPGGGFAYVGSVHEGFPYAAEISKRGYNAFVLRYRAGRGARIATDDMAAALSWIFRNAKDLGVNTDGYSLWGSSAGARMAAAIGSHGAAQFGGARLPRPAAVVLLYTGHSEISSAEPPTFVAVGEDDPIAPPSLMKDRVEKLRRSGTPVAFHEYAGVGHGFGLGVGTSAEGWIVDALRFWARQSGESH